MQKLVISSLKGMIISALTFKLARSNVEALMRISRKQWIRDDLFRNRIIKTNLSSA